MSYYFIRIAPSLCIALSGLSIIALGLWGWGPKSWLTRGLTTDCEKPAIGESIILVREEPLEFQPHGAFRQSVEDLDLAPIVSSVRPYWFAPTMGLVIHSLRLWGRAAAFGPPPQLPGQPTLRLYSVDDQFQALLDHSAFQRLFATNPFMVPLLSRGERGVAITTKTDGGRFSFLGQPHSDKVLQVLGKVGCSANDRLRVAGSDAEQFTVKHLLTESMWRYSPAQEVEFTANAYAHWLRPPATWINRFGDTYSLEHLADRLCSQPVGNGACLGCHLPFSITSLLRANAQQRFLTTASEQKLRSRLRVVAERLQNAQRADGAWDIDWSGNANLENALPPGFEAYPYAQLIVTGHHLEWMALAPPEFCPPTDCVAKAARFVHGAIVKLRQPFFATPDEYSIGTHAARALCLLQCVRPDEVLKAELHDKSQRPLTRRRSLPKSQGESNGLDASLSTSLAENRLLERGNGEP
jgi:hypothetical protein